MSIKLLIVCVILLLLLIGPRQIWNMLVEWTMAFLELFGQIADEIGSFVLNAAKRILRRFS